MPSSEEGIYTLMELHLVNSVLDVTSEGDYEDPQDANTFERLLGEQEIIDDQVEQIRESTDDETFKAMTHEAKVRCSALAGELLSLQGIER